MPVGRWCRSRSFALIHSRPLRRCAFFAAAGVAVHDLGQFAAEFVGQLVAAREVVQGAVARP